MAFLLRHYGVPFFRSLLKCPGRGIDAIERALRDSQGTHVDPWPAILRRSGSMLSLMPVEDIPPGYGLPARTSEGYTLVGIDLKLFQKYLIPLVSGGQGVNVAPDTMLPHSHGVIVDENQTGTYARSVTVPPEVSVALYVHRQ